MKNFSLIAKPLTTLCRTTDFENDEFHFPAEAQEAMNNLKALISAPPVLQPINYEAA